MTLDDFFTLTEMNNGLAAPSRVRELVAVMQKENDGVVKNIGEATRQWHAVASAIAATENQECLDLFIQLDGLQFIVKWLKDAQKFGKDSNDDCVEESITNMLRALGKLHVGYEKLVDSEMLTTVKDLLVHNSSKVQDNARVLFESWRDKKDGASLSNVEGLEALTGGEKGRDADIIRCSGHSELSQGGDSLSKEIACEEKEQESTGDEPVLSASSVAVHPDQVENGSNVDDGIHPAVADDSPSEPVGSPSMKPPSTEPLDSLDASSAKSCNSDLSRKDTPGGGMKIHDLQSSSDVKDAPETENSPGKVESAEDLHTSEPSSLKDFVASDAVQSITEPSSLKESVAGLTGVCNQESASIGSRPVDSNGKGSVENTLSASQCGSSCAPDLGDELKGCKLSESSSGKKSWESTKGFGAFLSGLVDIGKNNKHDQDSDVSDYKFAKKVKGRETVRAGEKSDVDILGMVDPLEMALQVAIEVEREVGDYREQSGSISEKQENGDVQRPDSPDSVGGRQSNSSKSSSKDVSSDQESSDEASPMQEDSAMSTKRQHEEQTNGIQNTATSQVTEVTQEDENTGKDPCNFDLNQDVDIEDADHPRNQLSTPISIVSASRATAPGLPAAPLQFEGNHGWKGSAATSAFRPASPRRMPESEKDFYAGGSASSSKLKQGWLDIDLNVTDSFDGKMEDQPPATSISLISSFPARGESSVGTNPKAGQLELDLNHTSEDGGRPLMRQFFPHGTGFDSQSQSSSSKLPSLKNIDLNDQPSFLKDSFGNSYSSKFPQNFNVSGDGKSDGSVISLFGTRVEVNRRDSAPQTATLPNGQTPDLAFDLNSGRTGSFVGVVPYAPSSGYFYNMAPAPVMPFSSNMYGSGGPVPYMVDARGAPVIPQIMGSSSAVPAGFSQTPYFMNMNTPTPSNVGAAGSSRSTFDLNSGTMLEGGSKDPPGYTQFLNLGPVKQGDDPARYNSQIPFGSVVGGKRKEPENGREPYPFKHYTPQWK